MEKTIQVANTTTQTLCTNFLQGLQRSVGKPNGVMALHEPEFTGNEWKYVKECIDTGWVSSVGKYVDEFERRLAELTGAKHAVVVANGTVALQVALQVSGVKPGDEVLVPALSFVASANAVSHCGATPHFVDSELSTLGLDARALATHLRQIASVQGGILHNKNTGRRIAAVVPMHTFGHPVDLDALLEVSKEFNLPIVEDAAESLGSLYHGRHTGTFGQMGCLSFNGNKIVTTGGGGAILTNDSDLARTLKHLTTTAKRPHRWEFHHDIVAYNFRLPNLNAALGCAQLEKLPEFVRRKRQLAAHYREAFQGVPGMHFVAETSGTESIYWLNAVRLATPDVETRNQILDAANELGYQCRPVWNLLYKLPMYATNPRAETPVAEALESSLINLPSSAKLGDLQP